MKEQYYKTDCRNRVRGCGLDLIDDRVQWYLLKSANCVTAQICGVTEKRVESKTVTN
jgi:hypothetical protein